MIRSLLLCKSDRTAPLCYDKRIVAMSLAMAGIPLCEIPHRNPANRPLTRETVQGMLAPFGVTEPLRDLSFYQKAFVHQSYQLTEAVRQEGGAVDPASYSAEELARYAAAPAMTAFSNERLEFMGDSILSTCVSDYLFHRFPRQEEGFLTKLRIEIVKGTNLARLAKSMQWAQHLWLSRQVEGRRHSDDSYLEDVMESMIGAVYFDYGGRNGGGLEQAYRFISGMIERYLDISQMIYREDNYKDQLLQYYHKHFDGQFPRYSLLHSKGTDYRRLYTVAVLNVDGAVLTTASHAKKATAEQLASKAALKYFGQEVYSDDEEK